MPFDSREYVRLIQPVGNGGLLSALARGGGGLLMLSPFSPFNQSVRGGGFCPLSAHSISGGGGCCPFSAHSISVWGGGGHIC